MQLFDILQMSNSRKWIERRLAVGNVRYLVSGDCAVTVEFGNEISPEINRKIRAFKIALEKEQIEGSSRPYRLTVPFSLYTSRK